jgi:hypothetical protein
MDDNYNRKQAMERLGLSSTNSFLFMERKYPEAFVMVNQVAAGDKHARYDKATLDNFAKKREYFKQPFSRQHI